MLLCTQEFVPTLCCASPLLTVMVSLSVDVLHTTLCKDDASLLRMLSSIGDPISNPISHALSAACRKHKMSIHQRLKYDNFGFAVICCLVIVRRVHIRSFSLAIQIRLVIQKVHNILNRAQGSLLQNLTLSLIQAFGITNLVLYSE